ncbi:unnamed protein product [Cyclocybe aegerita]|uniref:Uncharacterized protein n=1 Tax=Cyclocybe aegerita TaxID=1973307 RepID=A0A8S0WID1_CYCAE|nr:unnamed protein product [Cyclocybe aegerita]
MSSSVRDLHNLGPGAVSSGRISPRSKAGPEHCARRTHMAPHHHRTKVYFPAEPRPNEEFGLSALLPKFQRSKNTYQRENSPRSSRTPVLPASIMMPIDLSPSPAPVETRSQKSSGPSSSPTRTTGMNIPVPSYHVRLALCPSTRTPDYLRGSQWSQRRQLLHQAIITY